MSAETVFYILGIALVVGALLLSAIGVFSEKFPPSRGVLFAITVPFAALVLATMAYAWMNGEDEQEHRNAEIAAGHLPTPQEGLLMEGEANEEEATPAEEAEDEVVEEQDSGETTTEEVTIDAGALFDELGCAGCHTLAEAGATGTTGPALDSTLQGQDAQYIETAIVDPNAEIVEGFPPNVMPTNYGEELDPEQLDALVKYLSDAAKG
jgi:mono/diheme cytochrome c family protein